MNQTIIDLLSLTKNEVRVFTFLKKYPESQISDVSKEAKIARMTLYPVMESLKRRGLIFAKRKGKRQFWSAADDKEISAAVVNVASALTDSKEIRVNVNESDFTIFHGREALYKVWSRLLDEAPNTRVQTIQPTASIKHSLEKLPWNEKIKKLQENILNKPIIIEGVLPEDYYSSIAGFYAHDKNLQKTVLESFLGRATDMTLIGKEYFKNTESELMILSTVAYLTDWKNEISIEIKNPIMLGFLRKLYELAKGYGKKIDQNTYIKELIAGLDKQKQP